jgi:hypothetical protein
VDAGVDDGPGATASSTDDRGRRLVEHDQPVTADRLNELISLLRDYYGDVIEEESVSRVTWARIPHIFRSPYYVFNTRPTSRPRRG